MSQLEKRIDENFLKALEGVEAVDAAAVEQLRKLLAGNAKPKADDFVKIFTTPTEGEVK